MQKQPPKKFCKKTVLKSFTMFTGTRVCCRLFLIQNSAKFFRKAPILKNIWEQMLQELFINWEKLKIVDKGF